MSGTGTNYGREADAQYHQLMVVPEADARR
jgi:hypothetical protein